MLLWLAKYYYHNVLGELRLIIYHLLPKFSDLFLGACLIRFKSYHDLNSISLTLVYASMNGQELWFELLIAGLWWVGQAEAISNTSCLGCVINNKSQHHHLLIQSYAFTLLFLFQYAIYKITSLECGM